MPSAWVSGDAIGRPRQSPGRFGASDDSDPERPITAGIAAHGAVPTPTGEREAVLDAVIEIAGRQEIVSACLAVPAVIDPSGTASWVAPNLPGDWHGQPLVRPLTQALGVPVTLCNDARAFALAEWRLGAAQGVRNMVALTLGTGVGGAIIADGRLIRGSAARAGELGHIPVEPAGARCGCGAVGCLETIAGAVGITRQARAAIARGERTDLALDDLSAQVVVDAARAGDRVATAIMDRVGAALAGVLAMIATALASEIVVVGGGLSAALDLLEPQITHRLAERAHLTGACPVVVSSLGLHAGAVGAALWKKEEW